jgi:hypothetical protein
VALKPAQRGWLLTPAAVPRGEPQRSDVLRAVVDAAAGGRLLGLSSPQQHRDSTTSGAAEGFARVLRDARYDTDFCDLETVLERARQDDVAVGGLSIYLVPPGTPAGAVALRLRQSDRDAHMTLRWQAGKLQSAQAPAGSLDRETWESLHSLEWNYDTKRAFVLETWARVVNALRSADVTPLALPRSA